MVVGLHFVVFQATALGVGFVVLVGATRSGKGGGGSGGMGTGKRKSGQVQKQYWYEGKRGMFCHVVGVSSCCNMFDVARARQFLGSRPHSA